MTEAPAPDLLSRLRARNAFVLNGRTWMMIPQSDPDCIEAADEIERLRAGYESRGATLKYMGTALERMEAAERERDAAQARVDRLEEALLLMIEERCDYMWINNLGDPERQHTIKIARAA